MAVAFKWENHQDNAFDGPFTTFNVGSTDAAGANGSFTSGDMLIARVTVINDAGDTINPPAGWNAIGSQITDGSNDVSRYYSHLCDGSESGSFTFSWTNSKFASWGLVSISGASSTLDASAVASWNNAGSASFTTSSITMTDAGDLLVLMAWAHGGANTIAAPGDMTSRANLTQMSSTGNYLLATRSPGTTGGITEAFGVTNTFTDGSYAIVAFKPAAVAAATTRRPQIPAPTLPWSYT